MRRTVPSLCHEELRGWISGTEVNLAAHFNPAGRTQTEKGAAAAADVQRVANETPATASGDSSIGECDSAPKCITSASGPPSDSQPTLEWDLLFSVVDTNHHLR